MIQMKRLGLIIGSSVCVCLFLSVVAFAVVTHDSMARTRGPQVVSGELIIKFRAGAIRQGQDSKVEWASDTLKQLAQRYPILSVEPIYRNAAPDSDLGRTYKISFSKEVNLAEAQKDFTADPLVEYAEPNRLYHTQAVSSMGAGPV